ncbi:MAG: SusD/RagB family nutrient-binding outer membrane lipoprotein [Bacteroidales bacterium]|nr:SusD/RagB family nutrient-binding outer membrane lipoprotein [Bacteroidales bacterium]
MKKIFTIILSVLLLFACTDLEDFNENIKDPAEVPGESLFTSAQKQLVDQLVIPNVNYNIFRLVMQYWTEVTYTDESNYDLDTRTIPEQHWEELYRDVLKDLKEAKQIIESTPLLPSDDPLVVTNKLAIIEITSVFAWSVLVETFGDIPYTQALDIEILTPSYDDGLTIYKDLILRLNTAITELDPAHESFGFADNLYQGDVALWISFANSLKLRMGLLISDIPTETTLAQTTILDAVAGGVISSNSENATFSYLGYQPNTNPIYVNLVASGRFDYVPSMTLVDTMKNLNDPRMGAYYTLYNGEYIGGENGIENNYSTLSHVADKIKEPIFDGDIFDYAEVEFLLAEAIERGYAIGGTADLHYNNAITASILFWGGTMADVTAYLAQPEVAYATALGTWEQKIGTQKWIALYNRGFEAWTSWRMLDHPVLVAPPDAVSVTPVRYTYPTIEQTINASNYNTAAANIGGDDVGTRLFWDVN